MSFVDCSLSVLKRLWCIPRAAAQPAPPPPLLPPRLPAAAATPSGGQVVTKSGTPDSVRALDGRLPTADSKGTIDLLCMKQDALRWVLTTFLDPRARTLSDKAMIHQHCASIEAFRAACGYAYNRAFRKVGHVVSAAGRGV